jgi:hypothetical protein
MWLISLSHDDEYPPFLGGIQFSLINQSRQLKQCEKQFFKLNLLTYHLQSKFTIICQKVAVYYKKSLFICGLISQTSAEMPPKNGGVRKANLTN